MALKFAPKSSRTKTATATKRSAKATASAKPKASTTKRAPAKKSTPAKKTSTTATTRRSSKTDMNQTQLKRTLGPLEKAAAKRDKLNEQWKESVQSVNELVMELHSQDVPVHLIVKAANISRQHYYKLTEDAKPTAKKTTTRKPAAKAPAKKAPAKKTAPKRKISAKK